MKERRPNTALRTAIQERGLTYQRVAELLREVNGEDLNCDPQMVYRWVAGIKRPSRFYQERLCRLFGMSASQLGFLDEHEGAIPELHDEAATGSLDLDGLWTSQESVPSVESDQEVERRAFLQMMFGAAGLAFLGPPPATIASASTMGTTGVSSATARGLDVVTDGYRRLFQSLPASRLTGPVLSHYRDVARLAADTATEGRRAPLLASLGQVAQLAGRLHFDQNDFTSAWVYHQVAMRAGSEGENPEVEAYAIGCLASISSDFSHPREALALLQGQRCRRVAPMVTATTRSWLAALEAEAAATLHQEHIAMAALSQATDALTSTDLEETPVWLRFFDSTRLVAYEGACAMKLNRPVAESILLKAAASLDPLYSKRRAAVYANLATAYLRKREYEQSAGAITQGFRAALDTHSALCISEARTMQRQFESHAPSALILRLRDEIQAMSA